MYVGDKNRINISSSQFADFIGNNNLYVDKTAFIEHVLQDFSNVLLFTRPRRMGKSLNINTLAAFLDCGQKTASLFSGLYIETSPVFGQINKYPVIYLNFKELYIDDYKWCFKTNLRQIAYSYLKEEQISPELLDYFNDNKNYAVKALSDLTKNLYSVYGAKPYVIIDEYDKPIMDNINSPDLPEFKKWITGIFGVALKDNPAIGKAILTGVARIAKESMFSNLNNLEVYDVFRSSIYDGDFSLTEQELIELVPTEKLPELRNWYNNVRVGESLLYNIYSVMSYLRNGCKLDTYWSNTGNMNILTDLIAPSRADHLSHMLSKPGYAHETYLEPKLDLSRLLRNVDDAHYYSLAVQAGYLTYTPLENTDSYDRLYKIFIPNMEAQYTWKNQILSGLGLRMRPHGEFFEIFENIENTGEFDRKLTNFISMKLSYFDSDSDELEKTYHVFVFGMVLLLGYKCTSNLEAGFGRYDILIEAPKFDAIIEFKKSKSPKSLEKDVQAALKQIDDKKYYDPVQKRGMPIYKIGMACHKKFCMVKTVLHK